MRVSEPLVLVATVAAAVAVSAWRPFDGATWALEVFPIFVGLPALVVLHRRLPLTPPVYRLLALWALILALGGHYTYARVPLGFWLADLFGFARNHYDRIAHFAQGLIPAILFRELLLRCSTLRRGGWLFVVVSSMCLALSACYEFIEWGAALSLGIGAREFLGTQGDVWDTHWDMLLALLGSVVSQVVFMRVHDRALGRAAGARASASDGETGEERGLGEAAVTAAAPAGRTGASSEPLVVAAARGATPWARLEPPALFIVVVASLAVSAWQAFEPDTWVMETFPVFVLLAGLVATRQRFPFTPLAYRLLALSAVVVALGAHYTYARVPLGFWFSDLLGLTRNHYDRFAHVLQGLVPAVALRELLLRTSTLRRGVWMFVAVCSICLAMSALYEFAEWWAAVVFGDGAIEFLGTQGDVWDTQWDMLLALLGAMASMVVFSRRHDAELREFGVMVPVVEEEAS